MEGLSSKVLNEGIFAILSVRKKRIFRPFTAYPVYSQETELLLTVNVYAYEGDLSSHTFSRTLRISV